MELDLEMQFKKKIQHWIEALFFRLVCRIWQTLPLKVSSNFGAWLARTFGPYLTNQRHGNRNLGYVFPDMKAQEKEKVLAQMWDHLGRVCVEYVNLFRLDLSENGGTIEVEGEEYLENLPQPALFFSGHVGNWALPALVATKKGVPVVQLYRPFNNRRVDQLIDTYQQRAGIPTIYKGARGARDSISLLKEKQNLIFLVDQKLKEGVSVPFFGRPAMTAPAIVKLAQKFKSPLVPVQAVRTGKNSHKIIFHKPFSIEARDSVEGSLEKMNRMLESWILEEPSQWLWVHQRWDRE
ncbi:MAG: lauroyl acyltransferase [bacterium]|nr:lauroyl acyltransferase [bacterium]